MQQVEIHIEGHLDPTWAEWLDGFTLTHTEKGETVLVGSVKDQAALFGLLEKIRNLNLTLVSVNRLDRKIG